MSHNPALSYRPDIDGLRAVAVLAVVFYHFGIGGIAGGFVGVDVFFVISGFLITGIIQREIEQDRFTFAGFYERRIRRIFPALFVVLAATLLAGYFILLPSDLVLLGKSTLATLAFGSNVLFWRTSGYFDTTSELNPLLHTWSLAVEEQFYIGLPILLILVFRYAKSSLRPVLIAGMLISLLACLWVQKLRPEAAFYLSPFRAWELILGSLLAVGNIPRIGNSSARESLAWLGAVILLASILFIPKGPDFPGWLALGPVIGTAVIMHAGSSGPTVVGRLLSWRPVVYIGLISYSLYLWHWPVVVFSKYLNALEPIGDWVYAGVALSIVLAAGSYVWIETPLREYKTVFSRRRLFSGAIAGTVLLGLFSFWLIYSKGIPARYSTEVVALDAERNPKIPFIQCRENFDFNRKDCLLGGSGKNPSALLWGDSHALSWAPMVDINNKFSQSVAFTYQTACPPLIGINNKVSFGCKKYNENVIDKIIKSKEIKEVILHASWLSYNREGSQYTIEDVDGNSFGNEQVFNKAITKTIDELISSGKKVVLIGPTPSAPPDVTRSKIFSILYGAKMPKNELTVDFNNRSAGFYKIVSKTEAVIVNPAITICDDEICFYEIEGKLIYRDQGHLKYPEALMLARALDIAVVGE